jgi:RHS repeat-associated protein
MTNTPYTNGVAGTPTTSTYGYDVHGSVSQLVDPNSKTTASYGYTPYGQSDSQLSQGENPDKTSPINPFRYSAKRVDTGSGTLDMGVRRFGPDVSHFLTPDFFYGSLANLSLSIDPLTQNRYDLAGGNPISFKEWDGHMLLPDGGGTAAPDASGAIQSTTITTRRATQDSRASCDWKNLGSYGACIGQGAETAKGFTSGIGQSSVDLIVGLGQDVKVAKECGVPQLGGQLDPINCARDLYHQGQTIAQVVQHPEVLKNHPVYQDFSKRPNCPRNRISSALCRSDPAHKRCRLGGRRRRSAPRWRTASHRRCWTGRRDCE